MTKVKEGRGKRERRENCEMGRKFFLSKREQNFHKKKLKKIPNS